MRLRRNNRQNDENAPNPCDQQTPEVKGKAAQTLNRRSSVSFSGGAKALGGERQTVLREKTNLKPQGNVRPARKEEGEGVTSLGKEALDDEKQCLNKELCRAKGVVSGSPNRRGSFKASPKQTGGGQRDKKDNVVTERKHCIYSNAATQPCMPATSKKESIYEFEVDDNEPPSRRRRRKIPANSKNKKTVFQRFRRVRFPSRSETTASSVESVTALSSFGLGSTATLVSEEETPSSVMARLPPVVASSTRVITPAPPVEDSPRLETRLRKRLSTVLESPPDTAASTSTPKMSSDEVLGVAVYGDVNLPVDEAVVAFGATTPRKVSRTVPLGLHESNHLHDDPSLGTSLLSNGNSSIFLGFCNHHSTPVKARSSSDSSSFAQSQADATAERCFGFSSDEEIEAIDGIPSPVHASPRTQALRQSYLISSPSKLAPSRFAPEMVQRALILKAVSRPLQFNRELPRRQQHAGKLVGEGKKRKGRKKRAKESDAVPPTCGIDEYLLKRKGLDIVVPLEVGMGNEGSLAVGTTPPGGSLFGDAAEKEGEEVSAPLSVRPPRRSYERPWNRKLKKVIGGGLCLDSSDEEDEGNGGEEERQEKPPPEVPKAQQQRKVMARQRTKAENKENQMNQWALQINSQFDEVEDFELCLG